MRKKIFVVKTLRLIDGEDAEHIEAMKEEVRQKRQEKRHREVCMKAKFIINPSSGKQNF